MKVFQVEGDWSRENLKISSRAEPQAGRGQVRIKMLAAALNYRDLIVPNKGYGSRMRTFPLLMLSDGVGLIDQVGEGVSGWKPGDRVCPNLLQSWIGGEPDDDKFLDGLGCEIDGVMAEYIVVEAASLAAAPAHLDDAQCAAIPTAGVTAWRAIVSEGKVKAGDTVLVQGTGGVALFAMQFAKMLGAKVIITSSSDEKLSKAKALGADEGINYKTNPEWGKTAKALNGGRGVDLVVELGGENTLNQSLRAVRTGGTISLIGVLSGSKLSSPIGLVVTRHVKLQGITVGSADDLRDMCRAIALHRMVPVVDKVFAFEELHAAMDHLASGRHFGKVCVRISG
jgi:NADPH:quinone reductase-like Zn-dependent oxidoreductase